MRKSILAALILILAGLACSVRVPAKKPAILATDTGTPTKSILAAIKTPASIGTKTKTAKVARPVVLVREEPDGDPTGKYLEAGTTVTIIICKDNWCQIQNPPGWVFRGCLSDNPDGLGCEAK